MALALGTEYGRLGNVLCDTLGRPLDPDTNKYSVIVQTRTYTGALTLVQNALVFVETHAPNERVAAHFSQELNAVLTALASLHIGSGYNHLDATLLNASILNNIHGASLVIGADEGENRIPADNIREVADQVLSLITHIQSLTTLEASIKALYLGILHRLYNSMIDYRLYGTEGIKESLIYALGTYVLHSDDLRGTPEKQNVAAQVWNLLCTVQTLFDMAGTVSEHWPKALEYIQTKVLPVFGAGD